MNIKNTLTRIIRNEGAKEVSQLLGITQVKLKKCDLSGVDLQPLIKYLEADDCVCNSCKDTEYKVEVSDDFSHLELECSSCGGTEFSKSFICNCCQTLTIVDFDSSDNNDTLYENKICNNCLDNASRATKLVFTWHEDMNYQEMMLTRLPKEKQLLIAEYICAISTEKDMEDINEHIKYQKDEDGYSEEYIEIMAEYLKH